jgi:ABC-type Na+ transport system ATPase subunit NatA
MKNEILEMNEEQVKAVQKRFKDAAKRKRRVNWVRAELADLDASECVDPFILENIVDQAAAALDVLTRREVRKLIQQYVEDPALVPCRMG